MLDPGTSGTGTKNRGTVPSRPLPIPGWIPNLWTENPYKARRIKNKISSVFPLIEKWLKNFETAWNHGIEIRKSTEKINGPFNSFQQNTQTGWCNKYLIIKSFLLKFFSGWKKIYWTSYQVLITALKSEFFIVVTWVYIAFIITHYVKICFLRWRVFW